MHSMSGNQLRHRCSAAAAGRATPVALLVLLAAAVLPRAAAVKGISSWNAGLITHFGGAQDGERPRRAGGRAGLGRWKARRRRDAAGGRLASAPRRQGRRHMAGLGLQLAGPVLQSAL